MWSAPLRVDRLGDLNWPLLLGFRRMEAMTSHRSWTQVGTTVVERNIRYPTDSSLLGDGVHVLTRAMKRVTKLAGAAGTQLRDRSRSVQHRLLDIARATRGRAPNQERMKRAYGRLLQATGRVVGQAKRFSQEIGAGVKRCTAAAKQVVLEGQRQVLDDMVPLVQQVMRQTKARIFYGDTRSEGKIVSVFEPTKIGRASCRE